jgi:hypothetical protein
MEKTFADLALHYLNSHIFFPLLVAVSIAVSIAASGCRLASLNPFVVDGEACPK